jgi:hypothetical protein
MSLIGLLFLLFGRSLESSPLDGKIDLEFCFEGYFTLNR